MVVEDTLIELENRLYSVEKMQDIVLKGILTREIQSLEMKLEHRLISMGKKLETILQIMCAQPSLTAPFDLIERSGCAAPSSQVPEAIALSTRPKEYGLEGISQSASMKSHVQSYLQYRRCSSENADVSSKSNILDASFQRHSSHTSDEPILQENETPSNSGDSEAHCPRSVPAAENRGTTQWIGDNAKSLIEGTMATEPDRHTAVHFSCREIPPPALPAVPSEKNQRSPPSTNPWRPPLFHSGSEQITANGLAQGASEPERLRRISVMAGVVSGLKYGAGNDDVEEEARDGWAGHSVAGCAGAPRSPRAGSCIS
jgi:hypothetical protein